MYLFSMEVDTKRTNILFIYEVQSQFEDYTEENCLKLPSSWKFYGSYERDINMKTILCLVLNNLGHHPNVTCRLKIFKS